MLVFWVNNDIVKCITTITFITLNYQMWKQNIHLYGYLSWVSSALPRHLLCSLWNIFTLASQSPFLMRTYSIKIRVAYHCIALKPPFQNDVFQSASNTLFGTAELNNETINLFFMSNCSTVIASSEPYSPPAFSSQSPAACLLHTPAYHCNGQPHFKMKYFI